MRIPALDPGRRRARIEIIPLIDIIFFLLATFVMVSLSMVQNRGIALNLPVASTGQPQEQGPSHVVVTVTQSGDIYLDKQKLSLKELSKQLGKLKAKQPELKVFIHGDKKAPFGSAVRVLDEVRELGITKVFMQTKLPSGSEASS